MSDNISTSIETSAQGPKSIRTDAGEVTQHDLAQQIEADKYLAAKRAANATAGARGLRFNQIIPPGAF
jgi:DNA-binding transcriptional regulator YdaS (Cro superfamily)